MEIVRRSGEQDAEIFRLYEETFGQNLTEGSRARWRWQYRDNPATAPEGPEIWVALENGQVLGQYASMPVRLHWGGREVRSSWGMDVFLRPEARGKGIGAQLFSAWSDHVEVALGLGLTPSSYGLFQKLRYQDVGPVPFYQKVLDAKAVAARRVGERLGSVAGPLAGAALGALRPERALAEAAAVEVGTITGFDAEYDTLWDRARDSYAMCVRRDRAYLDWKYARAPKRYALNEARRDGTLVGLGVSRHEEFKGMRLGWIVDVFAPSDDRAAKDALLGAILDSFRDAGVARAQAFSLNAALGADLERRGFWSAPSPMQFCVRAHPAGSDAVFAERGRWHVVFGDSDMDR